MAKFKASLDKAALEKMSYKELADNNRVFADSMRRRMGSGTDPVIIEKPGHRSDPYSKEFQMLNAKLFERNLAKELEEEEEKLKKLEKKSFKDQLEMLVRMYKGE